MENLKKIIDYSSEDFLSFLYSERERLMQKRTAPGWSSWAIVGAIIPILYFAFSIIKQNNGKLDSCLCYYVFSAFCPIVLYVIFYIDQRKRKGDIWHVKRIKEASPRLLLVFLSVIYLALGSIGVFIHVPSSIIIKCFVPALPLVISFFYTIVQRDRLVISYFPFAVSKSKKISIILMLLVFGSLTLPTIEAASNLTFGITSEFELSMACLLIVVLLYILICNILKKDDADRVDELIERYLYHDLSQRSAVEELEHIMLGWLPFQELEKDFNELVNAAKEVDDFKSKVEIISNQITQCPVELKYLEQALNELTVIGNRIKVISKNNIKVCDRCQELLSISYSVTDRDFRAMMDLLLEDKLPIDHIIDKCQEVCSTIDEKIHPYICQRYGGGLL